MWIVPALPRRRRLHWSLKVSAALIGGAATVYLGLATSDVIHGHKAWEAAAVIVLGMIAFLGNASNAIAGKIMDRANVKAESVREALITAMFSASDMTGTDVRGLNAVFLVRRRDVWFREYLDPTVRAELGAHEPSRVRWTRGKGVVGRSWAEEQAQFHDLGGVTSAEDAYDALQLTRADWTRTRGKYGTIVAACTRSEDGVISGVIALNAPTGENWTPYEQGLKDLMIATARGVAQVLK